MYFFGASVTTVCLFFFVIGRVLTRLETRLITVAIPWRGSMAHGRYRRTGGGGMHNELFGIRRYWQRFGTGGRFLQIELAPHIDEANQIFPPEIVKYAIRGAIKAIRRVRPLLKAFSQPGVSPEE